MAKLIYPLINGANGVLDFLGSSDSPLGGEEAPTTKWFNPMWDRFFDQASEANGGQMPAFSRRGGAMKLPTSLNALQDPSTQTPGWQSQERPRRKMENY